MSERYEVPHGVEVATAWSWRLLLLGTAIYFSYVVLSFLAQVTVPVAIALLLAALLVPVVDRLTICGLPRALSAAVVLIASVAFVVGALTLVGQQVSAEVDELRTKVVDGITEVQDWAREGPLNLSDAQLANSIERVQNAIMTSDASIIDRVGEVGNTLSVAIAGFFIILFSAYFFLYEGNRIFWWVTQIVPVTAREQVRSSGEVAWRSLTSFIRATVLVALADALGIAISAALLGVPLTLAIGVLVFLGAFVPVVGAFVSGMVAVLVALVAQGPWTALFMLIAVVVVQQVESQVLQPFLMGSLVSVHPLAIILAITVGIIVAGVVGALIAVPLAASINAVAKHIAEIKGKSPPPVGDELDPDPV